MKLQDIETALIEDAKQDIARKLEVINRLFVFVNESFEMEATNEDTGLKAPSVGLTTPTHSDDALIGILETHVENRGAVMSLLEPVIGTTDNTGHSYFCGAHIDENTDHQVFVTIHNHDTPLSFFRCETARTSSLHNILMGTVPSNVEKYDTQKTLF